MGHNFIPLSSVCYDTNGIHADFDAELVNSLSVSPVHERVMQHFNRFALVGGMPAAIVQYAENKDILSVAPVYHALIESYKDDAEKYAPNDTATKAKRHILDTGWAYAGETISFEKFGDNSFKSREMGIAFRIIEKALLLELVYPTSETRLPVLSDFRKKPKLIWLYSGLVNYSSGIQTEVFMAQNIQDALRGKIAEHFVAQELLTLSSFVSAKRSYWRGNKEGSDAEVDFLYSYNGKLISIEVKSGNNAHLRLLHLFMEQSPHDFAVRVWSQALSVDIVKTANGKEFKLINLPFYYVCVLDKVLANYISS